MVCFSFGPERLEERVCSVEAKDCVSSLISKNDGTGDDGKREPDFSIYFADHLLVI